MKILTIISLLLSASAVAFVLTQNPASPVSQEVSLGDIKAQLDELGERLEKIEQAQDDYDMNLFSSAAAPVEEVATRSEDTDRLIRKIDPMGIIKATEREVRDAYTELMNVDSNPWERAQQARLLKRYDKFDEDAVNSMRLMWNMSSEPHEKAAALFALSGHITSDMRDEILDGLKSNTDTGRGTSRLNYQSVEALRPLLPDSEIEDWFTHLAESEDNKRVANHAASALGLSIEWEEKEKKSKEEKAAEKAAKKAAKEEKANNKDR